MTTTVRVFQHCNTFILSVELVYRNLLTHMDDSTQHHLRLTMRRIIEQQAVIVALNKRLSGLETIVQNSTTKVGTVEASTAASVAAVALATRNLADRVDGDMKSMEKKYKAEIQALQQALAQTNMQVSGVDQRVVRITAATAAAASLATK